MKAARILVLLFCAGAAWGQGAFKTVHNPAGGKLVYGPIDGQTTEEAAMGWVLRQIRDSSGDEPQVSRFFRVKGTDTLATYFTAIDHSQDGEPMAGFILVREVSPGHEEAALLTDDARRFQTTFEPLFHDLVQAWQPPEASDDAQEAAPVAADSGAVAPLHPYMLPDRTASVSLPDGWQVAPTSGGGTIIANGPNGEQALLDFPFGCGNTNDPRIQRTMQFAQGAGRNTSYARALYYPYGENMVKTFVDLFQMYREKNGLPLVTFKVASAAPVPGPAGWRCVHITGQTDKADGSGSLEFNGLFCCSPLGPFGGYTTLDYNTTVPVQFADQERATLAAVLSSFSQDDAAIAREGRALAAPEIARILATGRRAKAQADAAHASEDAEAAAYEKHSDDQAKSFQSYSNSFRDESVVQDNESNTHTTLSNQDAEAEVNSDPQRYEYVPTPNLVKGVDY